MTDAQTTYDRATSAYDKNHERAPGEDNAEAIFETSRMSDRNAVVIRTGEDGRGFADHASRPATRCHQPDRRALPPRRLAGGSFPRGDTMKGGDQWRMTTVRTCLSRRTT
jgi:hypothetical protein